MLEFRCEYFLKRRAHTIATHQCYVSTKSYVVAMCRASFIRMCFTHSIQCLVFKVMILPCERQPPQTAAIHFSMYLLDCTRRDETSRVMCASVFFFFYLYFWFLALFFSISDNRISRINHKQKPTNNNNTQKNHWILNPLSVFAHASASMNLYSDIPIEMGNHLSLDTLDIKISNNFY